MLKTLVIAGGGSAGHVLPSLRIADYVKNDYDKIIFIGGKNSIEETICKEQSMDFIAINTAKFDRTNKISLLSAAFYNTIGIFQTLVILFNIKPKAIFVSGGYASVPVVIAGRILGIKPIVVHVCDLTLGLAHKITIPFATHITSTFPKTIKSLTKGLFVGPITDIAINHYNQNRIEKGKYKLLVYGGSLGAKAINEKVRNSLNEILPLFDVIHICGKGNLDPHIQLIGYVQYEFVYNFSEILAQTDFAICRGGSNSLWELILLKIPHLAIPLPLGASRGDQIENCKYFASQGATVYMEQEQFMITNLMTELEKLILTASEIQQNMAKLKPEQPGQITIQQILLNN